MTKLLILLALPCALMSCGGGAVFYDIQSTKVHYLSSQGLLERKMTLSRQRDVRSCLTNQTRRISDNERDMNFLPTSYLIEVNDRGGSQSFELLSRNNLADKSGYYENSCIYELIRLEEDYQE
jgi:hypothetical protein